MNKEFQKYVNSLDYDIDIELIEKRIYLDDFYEGESLIDIDNPLIMFKKFNLKESITNNNLTNNVIGSIQDSLNLPEISKEWFLIEGDKIILNIPENQYGFYIKQNNLRKNWKNSIVYSSYYYFQLRVSNTGFVIKELNKYLDIDVALT